SFVAAGSAMAQSASSIVVEGNRRVEADTIRSYFRVGPGERLDPIKADDGVKALFATGLVADVRYRWAGGSLIVTVVENEGNSPNQVGGQQARQGGAPPRGNQFEAARPALAPDGAVRRAASRRDLPPQRPIRRAGHTQDH